MKHTGQKVAILDEDEKFWKLQAFFGMVDKYATIGYINKFSNCQSVFHIQDCQRSDAFLQNIYMTVNEINIFK